MYPAALSPHRTTLRHTASNEPLGAAVARKVHCLQKFARRLALNAVSGARPETRVVFILGVQRSGTRVPLVALESGPDIVTYREGARPFFKGVRLAPEETLDRLFDECAFPVLVLKPLCESHRAHQLLNRFAGSRVLWIFRGYQDTISSTSLKWSSGIEVVERIVNGRLHPDDWRAGGLTPELLDVARGLYQPSLSLDHANAILWYLRSRLLLDLDLFRCAGALVIKYEDLTADPGRHFPRVFQFIGQPLMASYLTGIRQNPGRHRSFPAIPERVIEVCETLYNDLDRRYQQSLGGA